MLKLHKALRNLMKNKRYVLGFCTWICTYLEEFFEVAADDFAIVWEQVGIGVKGLLNVGVSEMTADRYNRYAFVYKVRSTTVAQVVDSYALYARFCRGLSQCSLNAGGR